MTGTTYIYGKHAVSEALKTKPTSVRKLFLSSDASYEIRDIAKKYNISTEELDMRKLPKEIDSSLVHQGVIAQVSIDDVVVAYKNWIDTLEITNDTCLVILGELQDPHNVGAIIRSAAGFGISGVLLPEHNQAPVTGTVVKVSAGMVFKVPIVQVGNINQTVRDLKKKGFWIYGLEGEAKNPLTEEKFDRPTVFILGNEGKGIREKTKEHCDILLKIPMDPRAESLNVSASAAVVLYEWSKQHPKNLI